MGRREEEAESRRHKTSPSPVRGEEDEEAIRKQLRESGWKKRRVDAENAEPANDPESPKAKADKSKSPSRVDDERRSSRKSRSSRRSRSPRRREREHRSSRRKESSRRRSPSRSRSRSAGHRRRHSSSRKRRSSRSPSRSKEKETKKRRSRSTSVKKVEKKETDEKKEEKEDEKKEQKTDEKEDRHKASSSRKSSRRSRSGSPQSPSRSSRRRRHRRNSSYSRSRSASRSRRSRRSRSRSAPRDGRSRGRDRDRDRRSRRRRSYSRSRSNSYSRRRRKNGRSSSRGRPSRREAKSSPEPHQQPPAATDSAPTTATATATAAPGATTATPVAGVNPTITQLMAQYPTLSLQEIIAKMQASNVTMAAAVAQKPARELYVGNLPPNVTGPQLQEFLSTIIQQVGLTTQPGNPIINTWISTDGHFAFCEMRSVEECNLALLLNQLSLLGQPLKFGRPRSFMGPPQPMPQISARAQTALTNLGCTPNPAWFSQPAVPSIPGVATAPFSETSPAAVTLVTPATVSTTVAATAAADASSPAHRLIMSNIPVVLTEDQVKELVLPFGALKSFTLVKDPATGASLGSALFEYEDDDVAAQAVEGLNGLSIGGILLSVQRQPPSSSAALGVLPIAVQNPEDQPSAVLKMTNMVSVDELRDDDEYADLAEDVEEECKRFGSVTGLEIPRPKDGEEVPGLGCIYVRFGKEEDAVSALKALNGRKFGGNIVKVTYFPMDKFDKREFS